MVGKLLKLKEQSNPNMFSVTAILTSTPLQNNRKQRNKNQSAIEKGSKISGNPSMTSSTGNSEVGSTLLRT